jgi:hypothetical protein
MEGPTHGFGLLTCHRTYDPIDDRAGITFAGMAYFAGTGPEFMTCRQCHHWQPGHGGQHAYSGGQLNYCPCGLFRTLSGRPGPSFPPDAMACKYFSRSYDPPPERQD